MSDVYDSPGEGHQDAVDGQPALTTSGGQSAIHGRLKADNGAIATVAFQRAAFNPRLQAPPRSQLQNTGFHWASLGACRRARAESRWRFRR